ncbi:MAG: hypothetical protein Ct9H300mP12_09220 [Acidimicrobiales bacterium]|nr:MAG: hypothetical protein Ct9H300mP12_09220 [Acidimicrobiales bacterium]
MILSDRSLREEIAVGRIVIEPFDDACVQPSSIDLHLDHRFLVFRNHTMGHIDVRTDLSSLTEQVEAAEDDPFILHPGEFVLVRPLRGWWSPTIWWLAWRVSPASDGSAC